MTIRNIDWISLEQYFLSPDDVKEIDFIKIKFDEQTRLKYGKDEVSPIPAHRQ